VAGVTEFLQPRRSARRIRFKSNEDHSRVPKRRVQDRWYYTPVTLGHSVPSLLAAPTTLGTGDSLAGNVSTAALEQSEEFGRCDATALDSLDTRVEPVLEQ
jgi:hypothetical protein